MNPSTRKALARWGLGILVLGAAAGCKKGGLLETAATLEKQGQYAQAIQAYQDYLKDYPASALTARIDYGIARDESLSSDYTNAIAWYEKLIAQYPQSPEALQALLDEADLYRDKLKSNGKAADYSQRALAQYLANTQVKADVQFLVEAQAQSATALFLKKDFKGANQTAQAALAAYPVLFINPDTRAKVEALVDRTRRAIGIAQQDSSLVSLRSEEPFNKSYEADFGADDPGAEDKVPSPLGDYVAARRSSGKTPYLYLAGLDPKKDRLVFKVLNHTSFANRPAWSPDEKSLVYSRNVGDARRLEKMDLKSGKPQVLFHSSDSSLGLYPLYHPSGSKIAFVYGGSLWLVNADGTNKSLLKTNQKLDYTAELSWSFDGTMIRCRQTGKKDKAVDEVLVLDVVEAPIP